MSNIFGESDSDLEIKVDNDYAKNYNNWRQKEELHKLKAKYGENSLQLEDNDSSSTSDDDEDGIELTEEVERDFFKTLSYLKNKDPRIYDKNINFFESKNDSIKAKKKKEKALFLKDYERKRLLESNGKFSDSEDEEVGDFRVKSSTYVQEQAALKQEMKDALKKIDESDEDWGGMFKIRQKTKEEEIKEEADYKEWLLGQKEELEDKETEVALKPLKDFWINPNLDENEKFLRDYILNKKFLTNESKNYIPTYNEVIHDSDNDLSGDENTLANQEEFEHKYNFRFEEPDQEFIKRYPRTMENSVRKIDDKRKIKRAERKERKEKEKQDKMDDLKKLQELKQQEINEKIEKLKIITGNDVAFKDEDFDGDFDPEAHDKYMEEKFNDEFYEGKEENEKPKFSEIDEYLEIENCNDYDVNKDNEEYDNYEDENNGPHCEDEDFNMDCDYDPQATMKNNLIESCKGKKKRKRKSMFSKIVSQPKPPFDPNEKTFEEYADEYYKFDCEDIIGDTPCRFKYRKVFPNSFGLTIEEILLAKDRELNKWCSLKKSVQYRPDHVEKYDKIAYENKSNNIELKRKILPSLFNEEKQVDVTENEHEKRKNSDNKKHHENENETNNDEKIEIDKSQMNIQSETKKKNKKKNKNKNKSELNIDNNNENNIIKKRKNSDIIQDNDINPCKKIKISKKENQKNRKTPNIGISDARLSAYGINPKKFKNKLKYNKK